MPLVISVISVCELRKKLQKVDVIPRLKKVRGIEYIKEKK